MPRDSNDRLTTESLYRKTGAQAVMVYQLGDRVRIDIPDETDPDFELHGEHGLIIAVEPTDCSSEPEVLYEFTLENHNYEFTIEMHP